MKFIIQFRWLLIIALLLVAASFWLYFEYNKPPKRIGVSSPSMYVDATAVIQSYLSNETIANNQYLGKVITIGGRVAQIDNGGTNGITIYFSPSSMPASVAVLMESSLQSDQLPLVGDSVHLKAFCTGYLMDVSFNRGVIDRNFGK